MLSLEEKERGKESNPISVVVFTARFGEEGVQVKKAKLPFRAISLGLESSELVMRSV